MRGSVALTECFISDMDSQMREQGLETRRSASRCGRWLVRWRRGSIAGALRAAARSSGATPCGSAFIAKCATENAVIFFGEALPRLDEDLAGRATRGLDEGHICHERFPTPADARPTATATASTWSPCCLMRGDCQAARPGGARTARGACSSFAAMVTGARSGRKAALDQRCVATANRCLSMSMKRSMTQVGPEGGSGRRGKRTWRRGTRYLVPRRYRRSTLVKVIADLLALWLHPTPAAQTPRGRSRKRASPVRKRRGPSWHWRR